MNIENINKSMPFVENEGYAENLVARATENAIHAPHAKRHSMQFARIAASIAIIAGIGCTGWMYTKHKAAQSAPLDTFLSSITDEETAMLDYYFVEEVQIEEY